jgi:hypothetical protein
MLFSGEDSITTSELALPELVAELPVELLLGVVEDELEQAARPAARRPVAASATTLPRILLLVVNFDLSSRVMRMKGGSLG